VRRRPPLRLTANSAKVIRVAVIAVFCLLIMTRPCLADWKILLVDKDISLPAAPQDHANMPFVNVEALAPLLRLRVLISAQEVLIFDHEGVVWHAQTGEFQLLSSGRSLALKLPLYVRGTAPYLPLDVVAELSGMRLQLDTAGQRATLLPATSTTARSPADSDWQPFTLDKTPQQRAVLEKEQADGLAGNSGTLASSLPPSHDTLHLSYGIGYVQGSDWGSELTGFGRVSGLDVQFSGLVTQGSKGLRSTGEHISVRDPDSNAEAQFGNLHTDLWGNAYGARIGRQVGIARDQSLSLYVPGSRLQNRRFVLAYREERSLGSNLRLGGEAATDGSYFLKARWQSKQWGLDAYYRSTTDITRNGMGAFLSYRLGRAGYLYGSISGLGAGQDRSDDYALGVTIPLKRGFEVGFEHGQTSTLGVARERNAISFTAPIGSLRLLTRYQWGGMERLANPLMGWHTGPRQQDLTFSTNVVSSPRANFNYQARVHWQADGSNTTSGELRSVFRLTRQTQLQIFTAFPQALDPDEFRVVLSHELKKNVSVSLQYGLLSPYQGDPRHIPERGVMLMFRSQLNISSPARYAEVRGAVMDLLGRPVPGIGIRLNSYSTVSNKSGQYVIRHVPPGRYKIHLDENSLPADYRSENEAKELNLTAHSRETVNFHIVPLNSVSGVVVLSGSDDGTGRPQRVPNVLLHLDEFSTVSGDDGAFTFYNLEPGKHVLRLDVERLPAQLAARGAIEIHLEVRPDRSLTNQVFRVVKKEKETQFQPLREEGVPIPRP